MTLRSGILLTSAVFVLFAIAGATASPVIAGTPAAPTPTIAPTTTPAFIPVKGSRVYFHPSGLFSIRLLDGWTFSPRYDFYREDTFPGTTKKRFLAYSAAFAASTVGVIYVDCNNYLGRVITDSTTLNQSFSYKNYFDVMWQYYTKGWKETARRLDGKRITVDFALGDKNGDYVARMIARAQGNWYVTTRLVVPSNNPRLLDALDKAIWPSITLYQDATNTPAEWTSTVDHTAKYFVRAPGQWSVAQTAEGKPMTLRGSDKGSSVTGLAKAERGKKVGSSQLAEAWVKAQHQDARILTTIPETRASGNGFSVAYSIQAQSGLAVLINGPNYTLYSLDIALDKAGVNFLEDLLLPDLAALRYSQIPFPALQVVYGDIPRLLPSQTPIVVPTARSGEAELSPADMFTSSDGAITMPVPRGWSKRTVQGVSPVYEIYWGNDPGISDIVIGIGFLDPTSSGYKTPQSALEASRQAALNNAQITLGKVTETTIGSLHGYSLTGVISIPERQLVNHVETRMAVLSPKIWISVALTGNEPYWQEYYPVLTEMVDKLQIHMDKLPQPKAPASPKQSETF